MLTGRLAGEAGSNTKEGYDSAQIESEKYPVPNTAKAVPPKAGDGSAADEGQINPVLLSILLPDIYVAEEAVAYAARINGELLRGHLRHKCRRRA